MNNSSKTALRNIYGNAIYPDHYDRGWHITGSTGTSFPTTTGAFQTTIGGGSDAFVSKLNSLCRMRTEREMATLNAIDGIEKGESVEYEVIPL